MNTINSLTSSRRGFLTRAAVTAASGAIAATLAPRIINAQVPVIPTELQVLQFALGLEHLEAAFYVQGVPRYTAADFTNAPFAAVLGTAVTAKVMDNLKGIRDHEVAHVTALQTAIRGLGGVPVAACTYTFQYANLTEFLMLAALLENTGVMAYAGAVQYLTTPALLTAGGTIATVEARHAAFLNLVTEAIPFPSAFDMAKSVAEISAATAQFIVSCPAPGTDTGAPGGTTAVANPKNATSPVNIVTLDGSASTAADGKPLTYAWTVTQGIASMSFPNVAKPEVQLQGGFGTYEFQLTVTDSTGTTATDKASILYTGR
ncbi:MAG: ferritin-like domain-containing protein [Bryobacteraceae bacterium]